MTGPSRRDFAAALAVIGAHGLLACARRSSPHATVERVVSLSPSTTEAMAAIGGLKKLVGRSRYCNYPKEVLALPEVGGYVDASLEALLALRPDLVVGARGPSGMTLVRVLEQRGIATYFPETETFAQIEEMIVGLGERVGVANAARVCAAQVHARVEGIERALDGRPRPRVLLVFGVEPIVVAGPRTFPNEMLRRAGAANVVAEGSGYPTLGLERVLALDPDVVVNAAVAETHGQERIGPEIAGWRELRAIKTGHVVAIADDAVLRPGPRVADGLAILARVFHPNAKLPS